MDAPDHDRKPYEIRERTFVFARDVLKAYPPEARGHAPSVEVWRQLIRAAGSVGANLEEADAGASPAEFTYRVKVAQREAREAKYWLRLIDGAALAGQSAVKPLIGEASELVAILTTIAKMRSRKRGQA